MEKDDERLNEFTKAYQAKVAAGEPIVTHFIEPPFKIKVEDNVVHVDAPCMVAGDMKTALVVRFSLSAAAAKAMKEALDMLTFSEEPGASANSIQ